MTAMKKVIRLAGSWGSFTISAGFVAAAQIVKAIARHNNIDVDDTTIDSALCGLHFAGSFFQSISANQKTPEVDDFMRRLAGEDGVLNHDLQRLIRAAIAAELDHVADDPRASPDRPVLQLLASDLRELTDETKWDDVIGDYHVADIADEISPQQAIAYAERSLDEIIKATHLAAADWQRLVEAMSTRFMRRIDSQSLSLAAERLHQHFPRALREAAKDDFEAGGKQFAAVHLAVIGNLSATLARVDRSLVQQGLQVQELTHLAILLSSRFDAIERFVRDDCREIVPRLRQMVSKFDLLRHEVRALQIGVQRVEVGVQEIQVAQGRTQAEIDRLGQRIDGICTTFLDQMAAKDREMAAKDRQVVALNEHLLQLLRAGVESVAHAGELGDKAALAAIQSGDPADVQAALTAIINREESARAQLAERQSALNAASTTLDERLWSHYERLAVIALSRRDWDTLAHCLDKLVERIDRTSIPMWLLVDVHLNRRDVHAMQRICCQYRAAIRKSLLPEEEVQLLEGRIWLYQGRGELQLCELNAGIASLEMSSKAFSQVVGIHRYPGDCQLLGLQRMSSVATSETNHPLDSLFAALLDLSAARAAQRQTDQYTQFLRELGYSVDPVQWLIGALGGKFLEGQLLLPVDRVLPAPHAAGES